jgi:hypothetical protein
MCVCAYGCMCVYRRACGHAPAHLLRQHVQVSGDEARGAQAQVPGLCEQLVTDGGDVLVDHAEQNLHVGPLQALGAEVRGDAGVVVSHGVNPSPAAAATHSRFIQLPYRASHSQVHTEPAQETQAPTVKPNTSVCTTLQHHNRINHDACTARTTACCSSHSQSPARW